MHSQRDTTFARIWGDQLQSEDLDNYESIQHFLKSRSHSYHHHHREKHSKKSSKKSSKKDSNKTSKHTSKNNFKSKKLKRKRKFNQGDSGDQIYNDVVVFPTFTLPPFELFDTSISSSISRQPEETAQSLTSNLEKTIETRTPTITPIQTVTT